MKKVKFLSRAGAVAKTLTAALAIAALSAGATSAAKVKLRAAHIHPANLVQSGVIFETWADEIRKASNGEIDVDIVHGGALLGIKDHVDGIASGLVDVVSLKLDKQRTRHSVALGDNLLGLLRRWLKFGVEIRGKLRKLLRDLIRQLFGDKFFR